MNFTPTAADIEAIEAGAARIDTEALALRISSTRNTEMTDWTGEEDSKKVYDAMQGEVRGLYALADRMRQGRLAL